MAECKRSGRSPQLQHGKRSRLSSANPPRRKTTAASVPLVFGIAVVVAAMQSFLHARIGFRLQIVMAGAMLARGPTKRFGRHVEDANIHHHSTPGPVDSEWLWSQLVMLGCVDDKSFVGRDSIALALAVVCASV